LIGRVDKGGFGGRRSCFLPEIVEAVQLFKVLVFRKMPPLHPRAAVMIKRKVL
jgi:hypothetical protein